MINHLCCQVLVITALARDVWPRASSSLELSLIFQSFMWGKEHFTGKPKAWALHLVLPLTSYMTLTKTQSHCAWISSSQRVMKPTWSICWVLSMCQALRSPLYLNYFTQQSFFEQLLFIRCISYTCHWILTTSLWRSYSYDSHFAEEKTERPRSLSKALL